MSVTLRSARPRVGVLAVVVALLALVAAWLAPSTAYAATVPVAPKVPVVTKIVPSVGPWAGGTRVTVTGSGFTGATRVAVGGIKGLQVRIVSDTQIVLTTPARPTWAPATGVVRVTTVAGTSGDKLGANFTYVTVAPRIDSMTESTSFWEGGTCLTAYGQGFLGARFTVGGVAATQVSATEDTTAHLCTPARDPGSAATVDVVAASVLGASPTSAATTITYSPTTPPVITSLDRDWITAGQEDTLTVGYSNGAAGQYVFDATVLVNGVPVTQFVEVYGDVMSVYVPAQPAGPVQIQVRTRFGTSAPVTVTAR